MAAYYNENDPKTAAWLRELIKAGLIADGEVDDRSIELVQPGDVRGYTQCHFFAGIGGWSYALRLAGWPDDRPVWTGSCPCQPWSVAGKRAGPDDERDLWPQWFRLIRDIRPSVVFGEQVADADGRLWLARVHRQMETEAFAFGAADLCAAGVSAPHARQRNFFVAHTTGEGRQRLSAERVIQVADAAGNGEGSFRLADSGGKRRQQDASGPSGDEGQDGRGTNQHHELASAGEASRGMAHANGCHRHWWSEPLEVGRNAIEGEITRRGRRYRALWRVKSGLQLLAYGLPGRMGRLRGYGNAIVPQVAAEFIGAYLEVEQERWRSGGSL